MKKTTKIHAGGIYILRGLPCANTFEFENKAEAKTHLKLFNRYLKSYLKVITYHLSAEGWEYLVRIKDQRTLKKHIILDSNSKHKEMWDVTRIIGERIRIFRLMLRRKLNKNQGRKGSGVRHSYEKFQFESPKEAKEYIAKMEENKINLAQPIDRFRPNNKYFDEDNKLAIDVKKGNSILNGATFRQIGAKMMYEIHKIQLKVLDLLTSMDYIVYKLIPKTINTHNLIPS